VDLALVVIDLLAVLARADQMSQVDRDVDHQTRKPCGGVAVPEAGDEVLKTGVAELDLAGVGVEEDDEFVAYLEERRHRIPPGSAHTTHGVHRGRLATLLSRCRRGVKTSSSSWRLLPPPTPPFARGSCPCGGLRLRLCLRRQFIDGIVFVKKPHQEIRVDIDVVQTLQPKDTVVRYRMDLRLRGSPLPGVGVGPAPEVILRGVALAFALETRLMALDEGVVLHRGPPPRVGGQHVPVPTGMASRRSPLMGRAVLSPSYLHWRVAELIGERARIEGGSVLTEKLVEGGF